MNRFSHRMRGIGVLAVCTFLLNACGGSSKVTDMGGSTSMLPPAIVSFSAAATSVHVGQGTQLTAVFNGDDANIDGIGPVHSGVPIATPALSSATTFTLKVIRNSQQFEEEVVVDATYQDRFRMLAPSPVAFTQHVAISLADGGALIMGGNTSETPNVPDSESSLRFDPATESFSQGPQLAFSAEAEFTTAVTLPAGGFLLVGPGINSAIHLAGGFRATQAYDASNDTFHQVGNLAVGHTEGGTVTSLDDGEVLIAGGNLPAISTTERYDVVSEQWHSAANMIIARRGHTATRLNDGRVLIVGGVVCCNTSGEIFTGTAEIYDPHADQFQSTGSLSMPRGFHTATLLTDGRVLITGGFVAIDDSSTSSAEIYDPATGQFSPAGAMQTGRSVHSAVRLADGRVLALGGVQVTPTTDLFDPRTGLWTPGPTGTVAADSTVTLLRDGRVLIFGGGDASGYPTANAMLFE